MKTKQKPLAQALSRLDLSQGVDVGKRNLEQFAT
jgi:hypothetical protein